MAGQCDNIGPSAISYSTWVPTGFEKITGLHEAKSLDAEKHSGAAFALLQSDGKNVIWLDTGDDPTADNGMVLVAGAEPWCYRGEFSAMKFIQSEATATLRVYYGRPM